MNAVAAVIIALYLLWYWSLFVLPVEPILSFALLIIVLTFIGARFTGRRSR